MAGRQTIKEIEDLLGRGEYLAAYDLSSAASTRLEDDPSLQTRLGYLRVLSLARSGATRRAEADLEALISSMAADSPASVVEDILALRARLAKDRAFTLELASQAVAAGVAARLYEDVFDELRRPFACVNAATLSLLAGNREHARVLARHAQALARAQPVDSELDRYWVEVTDAEASLVLGDERRAWSCLRTAGTLATEDRGARASTRRQLTVLGTNLGIDCQSMLAPIENPAAVHYTGHAVGAVGTSGSLGPQALIMVEQEVARWFSGKSIGSAFGSLASGSDIIVAETTLARGVELHLVIPFDSEEFLDVSVRPAGDGWEQRFRDCLDAATTLTVTCDSAYLGHDELFAFASRVAMGQTVIRARSLESQALQLAVWDGRPPRSTAGTAVDVSAWQASGRTSDLITVTRDEPGDSAAPIPPRFARPVRAMLFGDVVGFSRFHDQDLAVFVGEVLPRLARILDEHGSSVTDRNTWGDAIFAAFDTVPAAASAALALQRELSDGDQFRMRMSAHVGPVLELTDPVRQRVGTFGRELTRAARIEPLTPPGEVYTTTAFASLLALEPRPVAVPEYVGKMTMARNFETIPTYVLKPVAR